MLAAGASMIADAISDHVSQTVTYRRGGNDITDLKAARGQPVRHVDETSGRLLFVTLKWQIKPSLLVYQGTTWEPQKNDLIIEANGAQWSLLPDETGAEVLLGSFGEMWHAESKRIKRPD